MSKGIAGKYIEFGIGNRYLLRTEIEYTDGSEEDYRGIVGPIKPYSIYSHLWLGKTVYILDWRDGLVRQKKSHNRFKLILGLACLPTVTK